MWALTRGEEGMMTGEASGQWPELMTVADSGFVRSQTGRVAAENVVQLLSKLVLAVNPRSDREAEKLVSLCER